MKQILKIMYGFLIVLYISGAIFVYFTKQNRMEHFYEVTFLAAILSSWGFFKKNKLIYFILLPGLFRIFLYYKNDEMTVYLGVIHLLATLVPFFVVYGISKGGALPDNHNKSPNVFT